MTAGCAPLVMGAHANTRGAQCATLHRRIRAVAVLACSGMIDAAKYADLVLLLVDGGFGFEMETFEFLNLLQVHGFPKVMGVLTHLDGFRQVAGMLWLCRGSCCPAASAGCTMASWDMWRIGGDIN